MSLLRYALVLALALPAAASLHAAESWQAAIHDQQLALYRLAGTFYLTTNDDADVDQLEALPGRIAAFRKALETSASRANDNRQQSQQVAAIQDAWKPVEALVTRDMQQLIGTERRKYINNGVFNAFQRATDVSNAMPALEDALARAAGNPDPKDREDALLRGAVKSEALASHYARLSTGYFDESRKEGSAPTLAQAVKEFEAALAAARPFVRKEDAIERMTFDRIEARWRFVQPALAPDATTRPRVVYRYLGEISENFVKLARPRS